MFISWQLLLGVGIILFGYGGAFLTLTLTREFTFKTNIAFILFALLSVILLVTGIILIIISLSL